MTAIAIIIAALAVSTTAHAADEGKHLFILSGQSNMALLNPEISFVPTLEKEFGKDNVIVAKSAENAQPIRRWYKKWKDAKGNTPARGIGDLYDKLMGVVNPAIKGQTVQTVTFVWMQGERDAREQHSEVYEASFEGVLEQLKTDLKITSINFVIGRLSDFDMQDKVYKHWTKVRDIQVKLAKDDPNGEWVDTDDLNNKGEDGEKNDLHYTADGYRVLGQRFAEEAIALIKKKK